MDNQTLSTGPDKQIPPSSGPDKQIPPKIGRDERVPPSPLKLTVM